MKYGSKKIFAGQESRSRDRFVEKVCEGREATGKINKRKHFFILKISANYRCVLHTWVVGDDGRYFAHDDQGAAASLRSFTKLSSVREHSRYLSRYLVDCSKNQTA